ncbi:methionyl-tRNA formyltransferase [Desulfuribacillus stibiiarsenatis]|uniref:Methionyl-tRNA formyltransferase n=1 Tax=Desulfuribacillus stibiiarsenatis TaxID=1390249 RepID=A0A1E5L6G5_9FIRM|nr:methionyl-tRNA formyltransferase [Desulfuribacillus stibiiarsenatis]OEH85752.1 methionyl-tRNA formyltransferase [Desulfuribacillus stibiiarsenatis]
MRILFMGTPDFAVPCLQALIDNQYNVIGVVTQPDRPKGRKLQLAPPPVKVLAEQYNIPVYQPEKISKREEVERFQQLDIDLVVTAAFGQILSNDFLAIPKLGCINVHASLLPKYRGGAPIHWSVINGETETGVTIMYMVQKLDAGPMLTQKKVAILPTDTTGIVYEKVTQAGAELLIETLPDLIAGRLNPVEQTESEATFAYNICREDERIDWDKPAITIYNQIRGLNPWPGAYTYYQNQVLKVWASEIYPMNRNQSMEENDTKEDIPGMIVRIDKNGIVVATGAGYLLLTELQPAGKKKILGKDFVNSGKVLIKDILGKE